MDQYINRYGKRLYGLCMTLCADRHEADDLYQDTWVKVIRSIDQFDRSKDFEPWLTRLCINTYRDKLRRLSRNPFLNFSSNEAKDAVFATVPAPERKDYWESLYTQYFWQETTILLLPYLLIESILPAGLIDLRSHFMLGRDKFLVRLREKEARGTE